MNGGLLLLFLGAFQGSADILHLPNCGGTGKNLEKLYHTNAEVAVNNILSKMSLFFCYT